MPKTKVNKVKKEVETELEDEKVFRLRKKHKTGNHYIRSGTGKRNELTKIQDGQTHDFKESQMPRDMTKWTIEGQVIDGSLHTINALGKTDAPPAVQLSVIPSTEEEGMFDLVNDITGEKFNDKPLTEEEASKFTAG